MGTKTETGNIKQIIALHPYYCLQEGGKKAIKDATINMPHM